MELALLRPARFERRSTTLQPGTTAERSAPETDDPPTGSSNRRKTHRLDKISDRQSLYLS